MRRKTFIYRLYAILKEPRVQKWISWSPEDESVFTLKPYDPNFRSLVLKKYFKHSNAHSFIRQLHIYGFNKLSNTADDSTFGKYNGTEKKKDNAKNKSSIKWYFTHSSKIFRKSSDTASLERIKRKSTSFGRDSKSKNVLSIVCVNYAEPISVGDSNHVEVCSCMQNVASLRQQQQQQLRSMMPVPPSLQQARIQSQMRPPPTLTEFDATAIPLPFRRYCVTLPTLPVLEQLQRSVQQNITASDQSFLPNIYQNNYPTGKAITVSLPNISQISYLPKSLSVLSAAPKSTILRSSKSPQSSQPLHFRHDILNSPLSISKYSPNNG